MSTLTNSQVNEITRQADVRSKPLRENFANIKNAINDNQNQIDGLTTAPAGNEVTNARDYADVLRDRLRNASKPQTNVVITGLEVTEQASANMTIQISAGYALVNGNLVYNSTTANTGTITAPDTGLERYDVVAIESDNDIVVVTGSQSTDPVLPTIAVTQRPLAIIKLTSTTTSITNSEITDCSEQGCLVDQKWFFAIQDAVDYLDDRTNIAEAGEIYIRKGEYYEEVDISGISNVTLRYENGAKHYRYADTVYCITSDNGSGTETTGNKIIGGQFYGNSKAGSCELVYIDYTDNFLIANNFFDGNSSSTATYKNILIDYSDGGFFVNNILEDGIDTAGITNTTDVTRIDKEIRIDDVNFYRDAADTWKTDDAITIAAGGTITGTNGNLITEANMRVGSIYSGNANLKTYVFDIGDWDMDATADAEITLTDFTEAMVGRIRSIDVMIRQDDGHIIPLEYKDEGWIYWVTPSDHKIKLTRSAGGRFDSTNFNETDYNRGWITVTIN